MTTDVLFEEISGRGGSVGIITLNRPQVLNALNHNMFLEIDKQLSEWEYEDRIKAVVIRAAEGRAFCAGGDIRSAHEKKLQNDPTLAHFFRDEYHMNLRIHHYPKPYVALLNGITMGGGVGVSIHGSHRVGTEKLSFAMPETGIGFYPDVGGTYFLARLPYKMGFYLGLAGTRITYQDCVALGLATHVVAQESFAEIIHAIADAALDGNPKAEISEIIDRFSVSYPESPLLVHKQEIETCFAKNTVEEIIAALEAMGTEWCMQTVAILKSKSPTSLKVTLYALQQGSQNSFDHCMQTEYRLTNRFIEGDDFFEGIRAAIIDKDQAPKWKPDQLSAVGVDDVKKYFAPLEHELV